MTISLSFSRPIYLVDNSSAVFFVSSKKIIKNADTSIPTILF